MIIMFRMHAGGHSGGHSGGYGCGMEHAGHEDHMQQRNDRVADASHQEEPVQEDEMPRTALEIARAWPDTGEKSGLADGHRAPGAFPEEKNVAGSTPAGQTLAQTHPETHQHTSCH